MSIPPLPSPPTAKFRSKTVAALLAFLFGSLGAHRFYLYGPRERFAWMHIVATALGVLGLAWVLGSRGTSTLGWVFTMIGAISLFAAFLTAIVYGLRPDAKWDTQFNASLKRRSQSGWSVVFIVIFSLFIGASLLMGGMAVSFQTYFQSQMGSVHPLP